MKDNKKLVFKILIYAFAVFAALLSLFGCTFLVPYAIFNAQPIASIIVCSVVNLINSLAFVVIGSSIEE